MTAADVGTKYLPLKYKKLIKDDRSLPLIYLVHGRAGSFEVMWTFKRIFEGSPCNFIAPQAPLFEEVKDKGVSGYSWWLSEGDKPWVSGSQEAAKLLRDFITQAEKEYELKPRVRLAFGFSQGAALISRLIQEEPETFNAVGLLAGFVIKTEEPPAAAVKKPEVFIAHGTRDEIVDISKSRKGADYLSGLGYPVTYITEDVGHKIGVQSMKRLTEWVRGKI